jgi:hypothetical protein
VRLTLPASVAYDLDRLQGALADLAGRMGHPGCASGCNPLYLETEREFILSEARELHSGPTLAAEGLSAGNRVDAFVPKSVTHDIDSLKQAVAIAAERVGCSPCCSGFDIVFRDEVELIAIGQREIEERMGVQGSAV